MSDDDKQLSYAGGSETFCERCGKHDCGHSHGETCPTCYHVECCCRCTPKWSSDDSS